MSLRQKNQERLSKLSNNRSEDALIWGKIVSYAMKHEKELPDELCLLLGQYNQIRNELIDIQSEMISDLEP